MDSIQLNSVVAELRWENPPIKWKVEQGTTLTVTAGKFTDLYNDPQNLSSANNAPRLIFKPQDSFIFSAKVKVSFKQQYDAGALIVYENQNLWAKICFEFSSQKKPTIVSVVTREFSDDCDSLPVKGNQVHLRIARLGQTFAFHFSKDGNSWHFVRCFNLKVTQDVSIGFSVQSPRGEMCKTVFSEIAFSSKILQNIRSIE